MTSVREFTAVITREHDHYVAACMELGIESVMGDSIEEARDRLINAMQHHIDDVCESGRSMAAAPLAGERLAAYMRTARNGSGTLIKVPEYLLTRN